MKKSVPRGFGIYAALGALLGGALLGLLLVGPRLLRTAETPAAAPPANTAVEARKIRAQLFYVNELGTALNSVEQEVLYGEGPAEQAKRIIEAQLAAPVSPLVSAIPPGTRLRSVFLTSGGEAFIDLSAEVRSNHPGGTTNEILTVYAIVSALTANLPAITAVQILVDGKEVQTLVGHLDLRRPLEADAKWTEQ